jgi:multidrug efflux system membrane fusion protein
LFANMRTMHVFGSPSASPSPAFLFSWLALSLLCLSACNSHQQPVAAAPPPPAVTVATSESREVTDDLTVTARIDAVNSVELRPRVSGHITEVRFVAGQLVHQGDVLFVIDRRWYKADDDRTRAEVARATATLGNAQRISHRADELLRNHTISQEEADGRRSELDEAAAALKSAEAAHDVAELNYAQSEVRAPITGRIGRALLTEGNYASGLDGYNTLLATIVSVDPVYVYATLDEAAYLRLTHFQASGQLPLDDRGKLAIQMELMDEEGFPRSGWIESFDNRINADTASLLVRAVFPNSDGRLTPGLFARVRIPLTPKHPALLISEAAVGTDQGQKFVLLVDKEDMTQYRKVTLGAAIDGKRIVTSGITPEDKIIIDGMVRVRPGMKVTPQSLQRSAAIGPLSKDL